MARWREKKKREEADGMCLPGRGETRDASQKNYEFVIFTVKGTQRVEIEGNWTRFYLRNHY